MSVHKKTVSRIGALLLALVMMLSLLPTSVLATGSEPTVVIAGSDFQNKSGDEAGAAMVTSILTQIQKDYTSVGGFLFAGDYSAGATKAADVTCLKDTILAAYPELTDDTMVLIQGNHDNASEYGGAEAGLVGNVIDVSGAHDAENYGVFVINEQDYMWRNSNETTIKDTAASLKGYLDAKRNAGYAKPIFVVSHLPLHYCMRTNNDGDGMYANYIFDVLNEAGNAGLNIIFMFGHNHSHGWDDYLGGAAIFLTKGDKINIAQSSKTAFKEETLAFTYLNAGYVGYYGDSYTSDVDKTLTMTTFAITDNDVTISRYSANGTHNLKSAGVYNVEHPDNSKYSTDTTTVGSPYTLTLNKEITPAGEEVTPPTGGSATERTYTLVKSETELVSGDQYLLIYNGTKFVLPEIVTRSNDSGSKRTGMALEATDVASGGPTTITGQYQAKEWQLVSSSGSWLLSNGTQQIKLTNTNDLGITATFEDAGSPFSLDFNTSNLVSFTHGDWELNYNKSRDLINGYDSTSTAARMYIYRLTDAGTVDPSGGDWVEISGSGGKTIFRLVDQLTAGKKYLIVSSNQAGSANAVNLNGDDITSASVTIIADSEGNYIEAPANSAQWTYTNAGKFQNVSNTGIYLRGGKNTGNSLKTTNESDDSRITWRYDSTNGLCETSKNLYISSSFKMLSSGSSSNRVYIYEEATLQTSAEYAKLTGFLEYTVAPGTSAADALAAVKTGIDVVTSSDKTNVTTLPDDNANITWTLDSSYRGEAGEYAVTISYKNTVIGTAKVVVPELTVDHIEVTPMEGTVQKGASNYAKTGSTLTVTYSDNSTRKVYVTLGMLSGNFNKNTVGDYTGLTVTYGGKTVTGYTLHVTPKSGNDYPEYPHEGAVRVGKTGEGINFQSSGIAKVELTATGVPVKKGADVIVMVDTSSSMTTTVDGSSQSRIEVLRESLTNLIRQFQAVGADGEPQDIRVAIADFNGYVTSGADDTPYRLKSVDHLIGTTTRTGTNAAKVYTGSTQLNADAFVTAEQAASVINSINTSSGTNYDYAFDATYQLGQAILTRNGQDGEDRDLFVIFMSDGAPFQYNYFSSQSDAANWNNWLKGTYASASDVPSDSEHKYFYNGAGNKHRMAEAIKGDPNAMYTVIRKDSTDNYGGQQYMTQLPGLGATMYSIGFCLEQDKQITVESMECVLKNISSDPTKFYYKVNTADELSNAFAAIGNEIAYAATNARFVDTMGDNYDLQMASSTYTLSDGTRDTITPEITVQAYDIYTAADGVATSEIGKRKGTSTVLETVTFNEGGTEAYSDKKSGNILVNGVICANTFWYNTTGSAVSIDTDGDGTSDYDLAPETFYWKMGTINQTELALSYYVYLTGSMEGTRAAGSYPTNESATLYYTNWLGNEAKKDTVSPVLAWKSANVSYAFYLVNEDGGIVVNQTTGQTGSFANKIAVTNPVVYSEVLLNSAENVQADILASGVLPEGYTLYDTEAAYNVRINSNSTGGWTITQGTETATTYVTEYGGVPTTQLTATENSYDYTHTTVWFAVVWKVQALPDTVVVDYGLPVDISVLTNDMFGENGKLAGVGAYSDSLNLDSHDTAKATGFGTSYTGTYGSAKADTATGMVRYTVKDMQMNGYERFAYAVNYTGATNSGYYYNTVTVIPATSIYYEDDFLTYSGSGTSWTDEGAAVEGATQAEDRPGQYSLTDANNIYGYDAVNNGMATFSLGTAKKVTVDANSYATATFTFAGTGFDVISMTSNTTGVIAVEVTDASGTAVANRIVNTYYGYTILDGKWVATPDTANSLYQVPVLQVEGLPYGTYTAKITATYMAPLDKTTGIIYDEEGNIIANNGYDLYLDAIRIYDPANDGAVDNDTVIEDAYKADGEGWPSYIELRNKLIEADSFGNGNGDNVADSTEIAGMVFIDGDASVGDADLATYVSYGPNNEVYLAPGQSVAFLLNTPSNIANVHIGIKSADGKAGTYTIKNIAQAADSETGVEAGNIYGEKTYTVDTTTDMYYDLTGWKSDIIVISNTGDEHETEGIISLTNIKSTYTSDPNGAQTASEMQTYDLRTMAVEESAEENVAAGETTIYMTPAAATLTLRALNAPTVEEPETPVEPDEPVTPDEPEIPVEPDEPEQPEEPEVPQQPSYEEIVETVVKKVVNTIKSLFGWLFK